MRPPLLDRLFGVAVAVFVAALLIYTAVRLIEAVLPALALMALVGLSVGGLLLWLRSRQSGW